MTEQLTIDLDDRIDPRTCPHRVPYELDGIFRCAAHDMAFVNCLREVCGEPPHCCFEPLDNGEEAVARRLEWMRKHKQGSDE